MFGGVTGAGTDFLVAAFRQAGLDIYAATTGQGLISDPIDKAVTFVLVYLITVAMAVRLKARFPQGEQLIEEPAEPDASVGQRGARAERRGRAGGAGVPRPADAHRLASAQPADPAGGGHRHRRQRHASWAASSVPSA